MNYRYVSTKTFRKTVKRDRGAARDMLVRKLFVTAPEVQVDDDLVRFAITTAAVDRENDSISLEGWETTNFEANPVVLWGHDSYEPPIGRSMQLYREDAALKSAVKFVPEDVPVFGPRAEGIKQLCRQGFLFATSVGFRPLDFKVTTDEARGAGDDWFPGIDFIKQELMEFSIVSIPCNPEALIEPGEVVQQGQLDPAERVALEIAAEAERVVQLAALATLQRRKFLRRQTGRMLAFS